MAILDGSIQLAIKTAAEWASDNDVLLAGQVALESDTNRIKVGLNGITAFNDLPYWPNIEEAQITDLQSYLLNGDSANNLVYSNTESMPSTVGNINAGTDFTTPVDVQALFDQLLYGDPAWISFRLRNSNSNLGSTTSHYVEVGDTIDVDGVTWSASVSSRVQDGTIDITEPAGTTPAVSGGTGLNYSDGNPTEFSFPTVSISKNTQDTAVWQLDGDNDQGGNMTTDIYTLKWRWRYFYGRDATTPLTETEIEALSNSVLADKTSVNGTYSFSSGSGTYIYFCFPTAWTTATTFTDVTNPVVPQTIPMFAPYTVSVENGFGESITYNVHRTLNQLGGAINVQVS